MHHKIALHTANKCTCALVVRHQIMYEMSRQVQNENDDHTMCITMKPTKTRH